MVKKYQQGGQLTQTLQQGLQYLALLYAQQTGKDPQQDQEGFMKFIQQLAQQAGVQDMGQLLDMIYQQAQLQLAQMAKRGAKLNYLKGLTCPAGTKLMYFKSGNKIYSKCACGSKMKKEKLQNGDKTPRLRTTINKNNISATGIEIPTTWKLFKPLLIVRGEVFKQFPNWRGSLLRTPQNPGYGSILRRGQGVRTYPKPNLPASEFMFRRDSLRPGVRTLTHPIDDVSVDRKEGRYFKNPGVVKHLEGDKMVSPTVGKPLQRMTYKKRNDGTEAIDYWLRNYTQSDNSPITVFKYPDGRYTKMVDGTEIPDDGSLEGLWEYLMKQRDYYNSNKKK